MKGQRPICSLSLDLDNQWSYMKTHGDPGWDSFPSYLDLVVPRFLEILDSFDWKITVFVVGQDAALEKNHGALRMIVDAGHEIGNHSFNHEPWLHLYSADDIEREIIRAEQAIEGATGFKTQGFRGPGYSLSKSTLEVLARRGYQFDASTFPTFLGPLARAYYFLTSSFSSQERDQRNALFGRVRDGLRPIDPYLWDLGERSLLEIPVTTIPGVRVPFHFSYILYLATYSEAIALMYFNNALRTCRIAKTEPSLLLHPLDFLGGDDVPGLEFFPAMKLDGARKTRILARLFEAVKRSFTVFSMSRYAQSVRGSGGLDVRPPEFEAITDTAPGGDQ